MVNQDQDTTQNIAYYEELEELINVVGAARNALTDDIVTRVSGTLSEGLILLDRVTRNEGLMQLMRAIDSPDVQRLLIKLSQALPQAAKESKKMPPASGGLTSAIKLISSPGTQESLKLLSLIGHHMRSKDY
jgi:uncharacterized protein YjgD (DUF1641 family)